MPSLSRAEKVSSQSRLFCGGISLISRIFVSESGGLPLEAPQPMAAEAPPADRPLAEAHAYRISMPTVAVA